MDPEDRVVDDSVASLEGKVTDWRLWVNLSDNLSPPQASGGVMEEESSLVEDAVGVDTNCEKEERVSSCNLSVVNQMFV